jgi:hypothetical protein
MEFFYYYTRNWQNFSLCCTQKKEGALAAWLLHHRKQQLRQNLFRSTPGQKTTRAILKQLERFL